MGKSLPAAFQPLPCFPRKHGQQPIVSIDLSGLFKATECFGVLFFFLSRNTEILLCFLLLAECRMFELHNFKIKQGYCFTAGRAGFCDKVSVANQ